MQLNSAKNTSHSLVQHLNDYLWGMVSLRALFVFMFPGIATELLRQTLFDPKAGKYITDFVSSMVKQRRESGTVHDYNDLVSLMITADYHGESLSDKQIADNGLMMFVAGTFTSAASLCVLFHLLATHPDVQDKLVAHIAEYSTSEITYDTIKDMKYLDAVYCEASRYMPSAPRISRAAVRDAYLGKIFVPKNSQIFISLYAIMHDEDNFEKPNEFIPERFMDGHAGLRHNSQAFFPFSDG